MARAPKEYRSTSYIDFVRCLSVIVTKTYDK